MSETTKVCKGCKREFAYPTEFSSWGAYKGKGNTKGKVNHRNYCIECGKAKRRDYYQNNTKHRQSVLVDRKVFHLARKIKVLQHYSQSRYPYCACCGESRIEFLTLDHKFNDGAEHRKEVGCGSKMYQWVLKNNFPPIFQTLCFNCNLGKVHGVCPHELTRLFESGEVPRFIGPLDEATHRLSTKIDTVYGPKEVN